ncbi:MAG: cytochrome P450 [Anaerolineae bacterium]
MAFDPLAPDFQRNPYPYYDDLRRETPFLFYEAWKMWFVSRYDDVNTLLRDRRLGRTMDHIISREERGLPPLPPALAPFNKLSQNSMFDKEPPEHTRLRSLVHKVFTPRRVESLRDRIESIANALLDEVAAQGEMDVLADFAVPLPVTVIAELLGVPEQDRHRLRPWSHDIVAMYELDHTPEQERQAIQAAEEFSDYLQHLAEARRTEPTDDLITALALVEESGDRLTMDELISTCVLLLNAGHEATVNVIGNGLHGLFSAPQQLRLLVENPQLTSSAIEELLRYDTPLQLFRRWVLEDMEYKGHFFKQGTELGLMFGAANRDPDRFHMPDVLDITREDNGHVSFGGGVHFCLGAPLARLELVIAFKALLRRCQNLQLLEESHFRDTYVIRGLESLKVGFETR